MRPSENKAGWAGDGSGDAVSVTGRKVDIVKTVVPDGGRVRQEELGHKSHATEEGQVRLPGYGTWQTSRCFPSR